MYVATFYSFKGGVGRTMALVNVAALLAKKGKRVLVVDFDLEAPGLPSYEPFNRLECGRGIVDYVLEYLETNKAPNVGQFIQSTSIGGNKIWIMPAGARTGTNYAEALNAIDWRSLYSERHGFLLMEDMKQQWAQYRNKGFDYVLIDSRTGHTDVGGICTRQLPDAIVAMFVPTKQNVDGLVPVIEAARREGSPVRKVPVSLHFCASNVPDLDDVDGIRTKLLDDAKKHLKAKRPLQVINHYPSLELLEQKVFAVEHPTSRLAKQYAELCQEMISANLADREGALIALERLLKDYDAVRRRSDPAALTLIEDSVATIRGHFPNDGEIAFGLAHLANRMVRPEEEIVALTTALNASYMPSRSRLQRAITRATIGERSGAYQDLADLLLVDEPSYFEVKSALDLLRALKIDFHDLILQALARCDLEPAVYVPLMLAGSDDRKFIKSVLAAAAEIFQRTPAKDQVSLSVTYSLLMIANCEFEAAMQNIGDRDVILRSDRQADVFNFGMAEWGVTGVIPAELFARVVELPASGDANSRQCYALCYMALGQFEAALGEIEQAKFRAASETYIFSCWSYLTCSSDKFEEELEAMRKVIIERGDVRPEFLRKSASLH